MKSRSISIILFLSVILISFSSCMKMDQINIRDLEDITITSIEDDILKLELSFLISNPNDIRFRINDIDLGVFIGESEIGRISKMPSFDLLPDSVQLMNLPISIDLNSIESESDNIVKTLLKKGGKIRVQGHFSARSFIFTKRIEVFVSAIGI